QTCALPICFDIVAPVTVNLTFGKSEPLRNRRRLCATPSDDSVRHGWNIPRTWWSSNRSIASTGVLEPLCQRRWGHECTGGMLGRPRKGDGRAVFAIGPDDLQPGSDRKSVV